MSAGTAVIRNADWLIACDAAGKEAFVRARTVIDLAAQHPCGRLGGMVYPGQIDTCRADTLRDAYDYAVERNLPFQTHIAQSVAEFHEMHRRHRTTPIGLLEDVGALGEHAILGHAVFLDHHPWLHWTSREDLARIADAGATVAHFPSALAALEAARIRSMERVAGLDWAARSAVELSPMVLDTVDDVAR